MTNQPECTCSQDGFNGAGVDSYGCPLHDQPDSVEELDETDLTEFERKLAQAILSALEHRGFYDCGKYLDATFIEFLRPLINQAKAEEREKQNGEWVLQIEEWIERLEELKKALQDNQQLP